MNKLNFRTVSLDLFTYDTLTILANELKLSRAEYIRHLVRHLAKSRKGESQHSGKELAGGGAALNMEFRGMDVKDFVVSPEAQAIAKASGVWDEIIIRRGKIELKSDLNTFQRIAPAAFKEAGWKIDTVMWRKAVIKKLLSPFLQNEKSSQISEGIFEDLTESSTA